MGAKIKKGDLVQVLTGSDRNKQGKVLKVFPAAQRVIVEGVNRVTKHTKAGQTESGTTTGGIEVVEAAMHISNVAIVCPDTKKPTRVGFREETVEKNGVSKTVRVRFAKSSGKAL